MEDKAAFEFTAPWSAPITLEPVTLLSALAMVTEKIGLVATCTTTYEAPWHLARKLGSLDHISKGRSEEHTSELQSLMRITYAVFCLTNKKKAQQSTYEHNTDNNNTTIK